MVAPPINSPTSCSSFCQGDAEYRLGLALQGRDRRKLVIQTKCGTHPTLGGYSRDAIMRSVENSLRVMGVDYLDALLLHDPSPRELQQSLAPGGALEVAPFFFFFFSGSRPMI